LIVVSFKSKRSQVEAILTQSFEALTIKNRYNKNEILIKVKKIRCFMILLDKYENLQKKATSSEKSHTHKNKIT